MKYKGFQSASDRRWQQRYESILIRKENEIEQEDSRKQRRKDKRNTVVTCNLDLSRMIGQRIAVICTSIEQIKLINKAAARRTDCDIYPLEDYEISTLWSRHGPAVGIFIEDYWFGYCVKGAPISAIKSYECIAYCDLIPVRDLGAIYANKDGIGALFE